MTTVHDIGVRPKVINNRAVKINCQQQIVVNKPTSSSQRNQRLIIWGPSAVKPMSRWHRWQNKIKPLLLINVTKKEKKKQKIKLIIICTQTTTFIGEQQKWTRHKNLSCDIQYKPVKVLQGSGPVSVCSEEAYILFRE